MFLQQGGDEVWLRGGSEAAFDARFYREKADATTFSRPEACTARNILDAERKPRIGPRSSIPTEAGRCQ